MTNYPYILKTGSIKKFLEKIPSMGTPDKITVRYLYAVGFKSNNDRAITSIMKFLKFVDEGGVPTKRYKDFRDKSKSAKILGVAVKEAYSEVFKVYPDADKRNHQTLQNFFSTHTGLGERAVKSIVETFKALCSLADLDASAASDTLEGEEAAAEGSKPKSSMHTLDLALSGDRKAKIIMPPDMTDKEIEKLKKLLDALK